MGSDELILITPIYPDGQSINANGFKVRPIGEEIVTVYGKLKSVGYNEYYKAASEGYEAAAKFDMYKAEYNGQRLAELDGVRYKVQRTYCNPKTPDKLELTLTDLSQPQE